MRDGASSRRQRERFVDWLQASPQNVAEYLAQAELWHVLGDVGAHSDVDAILALADDNANVVFLAPPEDVDPTRTPQTNRWRAWSPLAAVAVAAIIAVVSLVSFWDPSLRTDVGEQRSVVLEDGTTAMLNTRTEIDLQFDRSSRRVDLLAGEALFTVAREKRPFLVTVGDLEIRALGTRFSVYKASDVDATVTVLEGRVAVRSYGTGRDGAAYSELELADGEQLRIQPLGFDPVVEVPADLAAEWTAGRITFENTPLHEVVAELNRYSRVQLRVDDPELASLELNGVFGVRGQEDLIEFLRTTENVRVQRLGDERVISR